MTSPPLAGRSVGVLRAGDEFRLVATVPIRAGAVILRVDGHIVGTPSRHSIQVGMGEHLEVPPGASITEELDQFGWRFLNHSCDPNGRIRDRELIALRDIAPWEDLTFDYHTTEWDLANPFACRCGASHCVGTVSGYAHLRADERARLRPFVAPHLLELARG